MPLIPDDVITVIMVGIAIWLAFAAYIAILALGKIVRLVEKAIEMMKTGNVRVVVYQARPP